MIDFRPLLFITGLLMAALAAMMLIPAAVDWATGDSNWQEFLGAAFLTGFVGVGLSLSNRVADLEVGVRQVFVLTAMIWLVIATFGALPLYFSDLGLSYTDAFFEAMSGITTTGSTVISGLDSAPIGVLLWRALLQWLGGIGIIVMAIAVLPALQVGGMQLFRMESSESSEKAFPRVAQLAVGITSIYVVLTAVCATSLWVAGMTGFESIAHSMTTIATGGFSTSDQSIGHFNSSSIDWIVVVFMILGSLPFVLYLEAVRGRANALWKDSQVQWFLAIIAFCAIAIALWQILANDVAPYESIRRSTFNVISIITGTGFSTANYYLWGSFAVTCFFLFMFIGGCAGSTSCGIKIFRFQVLVGAVRGQMNRIWQPHGVFVPYYNRRPLPDSVVDAVMNFVFVFALVFALLALGLSALGLDFITSVSGAATALSNVGPALGDIIGPSGTFMPLPDAAKWLLSLGMLLGRLELFTILVLFWPAFWRA